jgi:hypothetical protein
MLSLCQELPIVMSIVFIITITITITLINKILLVAPIFKLFIFSISAALISMLVIISYI